MANALLDYEQDCFYVGGGLELYGNFILQSRANSIAHLDGKLD